MRAEDTSDIAGMLASAAAEALTCRGWKLDRAGVVPGVEHAADSSCDRLSVSLNRIYPTVGFPEEAGGVTARDPEGTIAGEFSVIALTCVPGLSDSGAPPPVAALDSAGRRLMEDGVVMWEAVGAALVASDWDDWSLGGLMGMGPIGGRQAGWQIDVVVDLGLFCPRKCKET